MSQPGTPLSPFAQEAQALETLQDGVNTNAAAITAETQRAIAAEQALNAKIEAIPATTATVETFDPTSINSRLDQLTSQLQSAVSQFALLSQLQDQVNTLTATVAAMPTSPGAMLAAMTDALSKVQPNITVNVGSINSTGTVTTSGGTTGSGATGAGTGTGTSSAPTGSAANPPSGPQQTDPNPFPFDGTGAKPDVDGGTTFTYGTGPDTFELRAYDNWPEIQAAGANFKGSCFNVIYAPGTPYARTILKNFTLSPTMHSHLVLNGYFGTNPSFEFTGAGDNGMQDLFMEGMQYNQQPYYDQSPSGFSSRSPAADVNGTSLYNSGRSQTLVIGPWVNVPVTAGSSSASGPVSTEHALADAILAAGSGSVLTSTPGIYHESIGISKPMTLQGGGKVVNPGTAGATYAAGAILDATGVQSLAQNQGGMVIESDGVAVKGWEVRGFGMNTGGHDGTGGIRFNWDGSTLILEDVYLHGNQMGVGPHDGSAAPDTYIIKNVLAVDNGLPGDPGYAHNFYFEGKNVIVQGGLTSIVNQNLGQGHPLKSRALSFSMTGTNYLYGADASAFDLCNGTVDPFTVDVGTVIEKKAGDSNEVIFGYGAEGPTNGNVGGTFKGTIVLPNDGRQYIILTTGPIDMTGATFQYTDGSPVKPGSIVVQPPSGWTDAPGVVTGLPA